MTRTSLILLLLAVPAVLHAAPGPSFHYDLRAEGWLRADGGIDMTAALQRYDADRGTLDRYYDVALSSERMASLDQFDNTWLSLLEQVPFDTLDVDGRVDYLLLRNTLEQDLHRRAATRKREAEMAPLVPFAGSVLDLDDNLRRFAFTDGADAASKVTQIADQIDKLTADVKAGKLTAPPTTAMRASRTIESLRRTLKRWFDFYNGYNPEFSWWVDQPWKRADAALAAYGGLLREKIGGVSASDKDTIVGDPVGRDVLQEALAAEMIPYSPEELIAIARKEFAWCRTEMIAA